jgi:predicted AAA+ superfamily ATPase
MIPRLYSDLTNWMEECRYFAISGPNFIGKTTIIENFLEKTSLRYRLDSGENHLLQEMFIYLDPKKLKTYAAGYDLLVIEEANFLSNLDRGAQVLSDLFPEIKIIVSSSSYLDDRTGYYLYPVSQAELRRIYTPNVLQNKIPEILIFGGYPAVIAKTQKEEKIKLLKTIVDDYLVRDIYKIERVKNSGTLHTLLRLVAQDVGNEVSSYELAQKLEIDYKTVERYLNLFEKYFILVSLQGYNAYTKSDIQKKKKYYFCDNGILCSLIDDFSDLQNRGDVEILWENFLFLERYKLYSTQALSLYHHYWKTWRNHEINLVEEWGGNIYGYEFQWKQRKSKQEKQWKLANPGASFHVINQDNYYPFCVQLGYALTLTTGLEVANPFKEQNPKPCTENTFPQVPPNDPFFKYLWNLHDDGWTYGSGKGKIVSKYGLQMMKAWKEGVSGKDVIVAILGPGVAYEEYNDPTTNRHYKKAPDFEKTNFLSSLARDFTVNPPGLHANDWWGLGTQICHIIAATTNNNFGGCGIAYQASILPIRISSRMEEKTKTTMDSFINAIKYAADCGARVIVSNMTFGNKQSNARLQFKPGGQKAMYEAVRYVHQKGALMICSSSYTTEYGVREGTVVYPGGFPECLAVGYTRFDGSLASFSNYGDYISVFAPTTDGPTGDSNELFDGIYVETFLPWDASGKYCFNQRFHYQFMANPHNAIAEVAGVAALVFEKHPDWSPDQVKTAIIQSAKPYTMLYKDKLINYRILDAYRAVTYTP